MDCNLVLSGVRSRCAISPQNVSIEHGERYRYGALHQKARCSLMWQPVVRKHDVQFTHFMRRDYSYNLLASILNVIFVFIC